MIRLKLLKAWEHAGEKYAEGEVLDLEDGESFAEDLIGKGIAEHAVGKISKAKTAKADDEDDERPATAADIKAMVAAHAKSIEDDGPVKRPNIAVGKDRSTDDPTRGYKFHRDFLLDVKAASMNGSTTPERLRPLIVGKAAGDDEQSVAADQYGGFLLPVAFMPELLKVTPEGDVLAGRSRAIPMTAVEVKIPARVDKNHTSSVSGGLTFSRREEMGTMAGTRMELEQISLHAHTLYGASFATEEILTDSPLSFMQLLAAGFQDQLLYHMMDERINGTGVGQYLGVLNSPCLTTISEEIEQAATTVVYENVIKMRARCWGYQNAIWLANQDVLPQLMLLNQSVGISGGVAMWYPGGYTGHGQADHPDTLLGRPIYFSEHPKTLGTLGDIILGNWAEYLEGTLQPLASAESMHVRFLEHERAFKFWTRNDGRPWWTSELTPKESSDTLSPFVVIESRTG